MDLDNPVDDVAAQLHLFLQYEDDINAEDDLRGLGAAALVVMGAEENRILRAERRQATRQYLVRAELLPNPRSGTPWSILFASQSDRAFITTMGFDVRTFNLILGSGFGLRWHTTPIPRQDTSSSGEPRPGRRSLDATGALGLVLHYLNSSMHETSLQEIFALVPSTVTRYISFALRILLETLKDMSQCKIRWPQGQEFEEYSNIVQERHPLLSGAFGTIDGLNLAAQTSPDEDVENATYNGWTSNHCVSNVLAFSPKGIIIAARLNCPGSWHDSRVAQPIYEQLLTRTPDGYFLVADTAFPRGVAQIQGRIKAPIKAGTRITGTTEEIERRKAEDRQLLSYRQTAEWGMRAIQGSFGRLRVPLDVVHKDDCADLLEVCARLHNLRCEEVGINQIRSVYVKHWVRNKDDQELWSSFENMLFGDQRKNDRVSRFYVNIEYEV